MFSERQTIFAALAAVSMLAAGCQTTSTGGDLEQACLQDDDNDLAISSCTTIIDDAKASGRTDYAWAYVSRGDSHQQKGDHSPAFKDYKAALDLDPKNADAYYNRGRLYAELTNYPAALGDFEQSILHNPDEADVYNERGLVWAARGDHERAFADYEKALSIDPKFSFAITNRGFSHQATGNSALALRDWEDTIRMGGADEVSWWQEYLIAERLYAGNADGEDSPAFRAALKKCSQDPNC